MVRDSCDISLSISAMSIVSPVSKFLTEKGFPVFAPDRALFATAFLRGVTSPAVILLAFPPFGPLLEDSAGVVVLMRKGEPFLLAAKLEDPPALLWGEVDKFNSLICLSIEFACDILDIS